MFDKAEMSEITICGRQYMWFSSQLSKASKMVDQRIVRITLKSYGALMKLGFGVTISTSALAGSIRMVKF